MKTVCDVLGVARSAVAVKKSRTPDWQDGRRTRRTNDRNWSLKSASRWRACDVWLPENLGTVAS
jgi:transcription elongation factor